MGKLPDNPEAPPYLKSSMAQHSNNNACAANFWACHKQNSLPFGCADKIVDILLQKRAQWLYQPRDHDRASSTATFAAAKFGSAKSEFGPEVSQQGHLGVRVRVQYFSSC